MKPLARKSLEADRKRLQIAVSYLDRVLDRRLVAEERKLFLSTAETITRWSAQSLRQTLKEGIE